MTKTAGKLKTWRVTYRSDAPRMSASGADQTCAIKARDEQHAREIFTDNQRPFPEMKWEIVGVERWRHDFGAAHW